MMRRILESDDRTKEKAASASKASLMSSQPNQLNSGTNTLSSMETVDVGESYCSDEEDDSEGQPVWGRLFPLGAHFNTLDLIKDVYTFGRGEECDYCFNVSNLRKHPCFLAYSKVHFKIMRNRTSTGWHPFLEDISSNGTFINGVKVGKNNKQVLANNDEIALAMKRNRVFVFMDPSSNDDQQYPVEILDHYTMSKVLGRGACGEVRLAFEKKTCKKFAIKIISKKNFSVSGKTATNLSYEVMNEVNVLKALKHPCIIQVEDVIDTHETLFIILELVEGGELFDRVVSCGQLNEQTAKLLFYQMVCAVKYLHDEGITHRDLKPENVLLATDDEETLIKVTDFGLSKFVDGNSLMKTFCGTPNYLAPEVLSTAGSGSYTQAVDCWSLGVILFICLGGYPPFTEERKDLPLVQQIVKGRFTFKKEEWERVSPEAKDLIQKLLTVDPRERLTLSDAMNHPWLKDEAMSIKAQRLMFSECNGNLSQETRSKRPLLKRQHEESNDTIDGDTSNDSTECQSKRHRIGTCNDNAQKNCAT